MDMLVTGNGAVYMLEEENDLWISDLLGWFGSIEDTLDDDAADRALDTICFLQDEDVNAPMDDINVAFPVSLTFADLELR